MDFKKNKSRILGFVFFDSRSVLNSAETGWILFVTKALGTSYQSAIKSGFTDSKTDHATRVSFKYGCLRGVYGTPFFFVNGFPLTDAGSPLNYKGWREVIDPLVSKKGTNWQDPMHSL
ncbi:hypothetical protein Pfo_021445 [Paulownia fortunei]|nr:hypothetical protein Pfo_021445 [Paulownia fortunei]